jgi:hypothetical protein
MEDFSRRTEGKRQVWKQMRRILSKINNTTLLRDQPNVKPLTQDRRYDNVLLGQAYRSPYGEVIDEQWNDGMMTSRRKTEDVGHKPPQYHFIHHKSDID